MRTSLKSPNHSTTQPFQSIAFVSILNGVFLDIMSEITAAFALAALQQVQEEDRCDQLAADLINFGFVKSGYSCLEKLEMFNAEISNIIKSPNEAVPLYNTIKSHLAAEAELVSGITDLLSALRENGALTFTTSVVPQRELDQQMRSTPQGRQIMPFLNQALGAQDLYRKLIGHLRYIQKYYPIIKKFYLLFDAPSEVRMGHEARAEFDVRVIGFALPYSAVQVSQAFSKGQAFLLSHNPLYRPQSTNLDLDHLVLPTLNRLEEQLRSAGADGVIVYRDAHSLTQLADDLMADR